MEPPLRHAHKMIKIAVSGTAVTDFLRQKDLDIVEAVGRAIAEQGAICLTGATTGEPFWAAKGAKLAGGISIGFSPATSEADHVERWKLPLDYTDLIVYIGGGYPPRDIALVRAADAVAIMTGRIGTIHEFTVAFEENKPIGILHTDDSKTDDVIKYIVNESHRRDDNKKVFFESDPKKLVARLIELAKLDKEGHL